LWARTERSRFFDTDLFGDAAWDMLLGLYVLGSGRSPVSTARLMELIEIPRSAVLRWRKYLQDRDLIARSAHVGGARGQYLELTEPARHALDNYFSRVCGPRP
jgi:DNA-binding MarR family transcriptional regulator